MKNVLILATLSFLMSCKDTKSSLENEQVLEEPQTIMVEESTIKFDAKIRNKYGETAYIYQVQSKLTDEEIEKYKESVPTKPARIYFWIDNKPESLKGVLPTFECLFEQNRLSDSRHNDGREFDINRTGCKPKDEKPAPRLGQDGGVIR